MLERSASGKENNGLLTLVLGRGMEHGNRGLICWESIDGSSQVFSPFIRNQDARFFS